MCDPHLAVKTLEQRGIMVRVLPSPLGADGWCYRVKSHGGVEYQISLDELLQLQKEDKLNWEDIKNLIEKSGKRRPIDS